MFRLVWQCFLSPRLYKIYGEDTLDSQYKPYLLERIGDRVVIMASAITNIIKYMSPFMSLYLLKRGLFSYQEAFVLAHVLGGVACIVGFAYFMRSIGRALNWQYVEFLHTLADTGIDRRQYIDALRRYDFDFTEWPASYVMPLKQSVAWYQQLPFTKTANPELPRYKRTVLQILAFLATHTFAIRLIYPGSLSVIHNLLWLPLFKGRVLLTEKHGGARAKLIATDGNSVDTMFVDHRRKKPRGDTLVICCEGNSGFYEIGIMNTPIKAGYSVLGWNHPGFCDSTGIPFPSQEQHAMDVVIQYAVHELEFPLEDIVLFGWSIGGYTATWAAVNYPEIRGLVLDATFDDILPLAVNQMPKSWNLLVKEVIRNYADLNIGEMVLQYSGPIHLVRRTEDEVLCLRQGLLSTNRCNNLLIKLLEVRHPDVPEIIEMTPQLKKMVALTDTQRVVLSSGERLTESEKKMVDLISKYMRDYRSTHCTPLPHDVLSAVVDTITDTWRQNQED